MRDQVFVIAIGGQEAANQRGRAAMLLAGNVGHQPAEARQHVDGRIVAAVGQAAGEPRMAVQQAANGVGDRLVGIVALDQHGEETP